MEASPPYIRRTGKNLPEAGPLSKYNPLLNPPPQRGGGNEKTLIFPLLWRGRRGGGGIPPAGGKMVFAFFHG
jgi:hypothetical protein